MDTELVERKKGEIIEKYGPWTAHNIRLADSVYTIEEGVVGDEIKLKRIIQSVSDLAGRPLQDLRVLDLASLEGMYAIELALHGAKVVAIEGRKENLAKAQFAREVLALNNLELVQDDVRNLSKEKYGCFDVVLCLGILYHLDVPDVFSFLERIAEVCQRLAVIDTHVSMVPEKSCHYKEREYWGRTYWERADDYTPEAWTSLDNPTSFWFTRPSLHNVLSHVGFTSVYECHVPPEPKKPVDRITLLAVQGLRQDLTSSPLANAQPIENLPEKHGARSMARLLNRSRTVGRFLPAPMRKHLKRLLHSRL